MCILPKQNASDIAHSAMLMAREDNPFADAEKKIMDAAKVAGRKATVVNRHIVRPYAPHVVQVAIDFQIL
jgi:tRNA G37 N-methylase Trm5